MKSVPTQGQPAPLLVLPEAQPSPQLNDLALNVQEVCRRFNKCSRTIYLWCKRESFPNYKVGQSLMFSWPAIEQWVAKRIEGRL